MMYQEVNPITGRNQFLLVRARFVLTGTRGSPGQQFKDEDMRRLGQAGYEAILERCGDRPPPGCHE